MLYGYGTFEINRECDKQFAPECFGPGQLSGVSHGFVTVQVRQPTPPWWLAYQRAIAKHLGSQSTWHDASFQRGYEEGLADANEDIARMKRRLADADDRLERLRSALSEDDE